METKLTFKELLGLYEGISELGDLKSTVKFSIKLSKFKRLELQPKVEILEEQIKKLREDLKVDKILERKVESEIKELNQFFHTRSEEILKEEIEVTLINISEAELAAQEEFNKDFKVSPNLIEKIHYIIV